MDHRKRAREYQNSNQANGNRSGRERRSTLFSSNQNKKCARSSKDKYDNALVLPTLNKEDVDAYRCSMEHNISRELLQKGYHKSFALLRKLLRGQEAEAAAANLAESGEEWTRNLAKNSLAKLRIISEKLMEVEDVYRAEIRMEMTGDKSNNEESNRTSRDFNFNFFSLATSFEDLMTNSVESINCPATPFPSKVSLRRNINCSSTLTKIHTIFMSLGKCFERHNCDLWLANHFYAEAVKASNRMPLRCDGALGAISRQRLGRVLMKRGKFAEAAATFESYYNISLDKPWENENGQRCEVDASILLARCFFQLSDGADQIQEKLDFSQGAFEAASRTKDRPLEEESKIRLSQAKYDAGFFEDAMNLAKDFAVFATHQTPMDQALKALEMTARVSNMQGDSMSAINFGVKWTETAMEEEMERSFYEACLFMGSVCDELNKKPLVDVFLHTAFRFAHACFCRGDEEIMREGGGGGSGAEEARRKDDWASSEGLLVRGMGEDGRLRRTPSLILRHDSAAADVSKPVGDDSTGRVGARSSTNGIGCWPQKIGTSERRRSKVEIAVAVGNSVIGVVGDHVGIPSIENIRSILAWRNDLVLPSRIWGEMTTRKRILLFGPAEEEDEGEGDKKERRSERMAKEVDEGEELVEGEGEGGKKEGEREDWVRGGKRTKECRRKRSEREMRRGRMASEIMKSDSLKECLRELRAIYAI